MQVENNYRIGLTILKVDPHDGFLMKAISLRRAIGSKDTLKRMAALFLRKNGIMLAIIAALAAGFGETTGIAATTAGNGTRKWGTVDTVRGSIGGGLPVATITITFTNAANVTVTLAATTNAAGIWAVDIPPGYKTGDTVVATVTAGGGGANGCTNSFFLAAIPPPPATTVVASHTVLPGSTAVVGGSTFTMQGGYTVQSIDYGSNPASPTFGQFDGEVLAAGFDLHGSNGLGTNFSLQLPSDLPFSLSLLPASNSTASFNIPVSGTVTVNSSTSSFSGTAIGISTYDEVGDESYDYDLALTSGFGPIQAHISSSGSVTSIPEPSAIAMLLAGVGLLFLRRQRVYADAAPSDNHGTDS